MRSIKILTIIAISLFFLNFPAVSASDEWNMSISATRHVEIVTFGISPNATNNPDLGLDEATTVPPGPETPFTYLNLMGSKDSAPLSKMINKDKTTWLLGVSINRLGSTTLYWNTSGLPSDVDLAINGINMKNANSLVLDGNPTGGIIHYLVITDDIAAPVITNITYTTPLPDSVIITWDTDEEGDSLVKYGTISGNYTYTNYNSSMVTSHSFTLEDLTQDTTYFFVVNSTDKFGYSNQSDEYSFKTCRYPSPGITGFSPSSPVYNSLGTPRIFSITVNQSVDVTWYINGSKLYTNHSVTQASYTNTSAVYGYYNISAIANNTNGTVMQTWLWTVVGLPKNITITAEPKSIVADDDDFSTISAMVKDFQGNNVIDGTVVTFLTNRDSDTLSSSNAVTVNGIAEITVIGNKIGNSRIMATYDSIEDTVDVTMTCGLAADIINISGIGQTDFINYILPAPFVFQAKDTNDNVVSNMDVDFIVIGDNSASASVSTATTDADGQVSVTLTLGSLPGTYGIRCEVSNNTAINNTITATATAIPGPETISFDPLSPVSNIEGEPRTFNITTDQVVNITWYINGSELYTDHSVTEASYTNTSAVHGHYNVSAVANNANGTVMQTWLWTVTETRQAASVIIISGTGQTELINSMLSSPFIFQVNDTDNNALSKIDVNFIVTGDNNASASVTTGTTGADGQVSVTLTLGSISGAYGIMCEVSDNPAINNTITATATTIPPPEILFLDPSGSQVSDNEGASRTFSITTDQVVDVTWYINGTEVYSDTGVKTSNYTNLSAVVGIWNVLAIAVNDNGTRMHTWVWNVTETGVVSVSLTLNPGWNLISIPVEPVNDSVYSVFSNKDIDKSCIYKYGQFGFETVTSVESKIGYWVYSEMTIPLNIIGNSMTNITLVLNPGWNLIGIPVNPINSSVDSVFSNRDIDKSCIYKYGQFGFETVTFVEPKIGYWVYSEVKIPIQIEGTPVTS